MNSREVAGRLGTDARTLRRFLRDPKSTFQAVGSGGRYEFEESDLPGLEKRFADWMKGQQTVDRTPREKLPTPAPAVTSSRAKTQAEKDAEVWAEEGTVVIDDIRDPRVRARVRCEAHERARRLDERLMAHGMHISQWRERV
jgi:hypothetical protein